jgi:hypothetical protein
MDIEELKAEVTESKRVVEAGRGVPAVMVFLAKHGDELIALAEAEPLNKAARELAEAELQAEDPMPEIMTSQARGISDDEALELASNMNGVSHARVAALAAYRAAKKGTQ